MILNLSKSKKLSFYRRTDIYIGERDFDEIKVLLPTEVDGNKISDLLLKLHLVNNKGEYIHIALSKKNDGVVMVGSTMIVADLTNVAQDFFIYIEMIKGDNEVIGKTNVLKITINPLPDEKDRIIPKEEYEETIDELTEIIERNTEAMNRINEFEDGKSAYEIAVDNGYVGSEEEWLESLKGTDGTDGATGADGYSPTATVTQTQNGATVSITDKNGTTTANISNGVNGSDYILTAQDKSDIADLVLAALPTTQGVQYGNTSN